ncbi:MAG: translation initiation factor IF-3 [Anaerotruncus sp.]|nr:translation initiation factor IF-3 [Anaerotruncus sp.]
MAGQYGFPLRGDWIDESVGCCCLRSFYYVLQVLEVFRISTKDLHINEEIRDKEVRLIGPDGEQLGIVAISVAQNMAVEKNLDLVKIAPQAVPPVCKIMDYGKYKFEQAKREKEARKNQKVIEIKEVRLSLNIDTNDFNTKVNRAIKFLEGGDKVKATLRFKGREMAHPELGTSIMQRFSEAVAAYGVVEKLPKLEGRSMVMFVSPKPAANIKGGKSNA